MLQRSGLGLLGLLLLLPRQVSSGTVHRLTLLLLLVARTTARVLSVSSSIASSSVSPAVSAP